MAKMKKYPWYVVSVEFNKILSGWDFKSDANDHKKDCQDAEIICKVSAYNTVVKSGLNPAAPKDWIDSQKLDQY